MTFGDYLDTLDQYKHKIPINAGVWESFSDAMQEAQEKSIMACKAGFVSHKEIVMTSHVYFRMWQIIFEDVVKNGNDTQKGIITKEHIEIAEECAQKCAKQFIAEVPTKLKEFDEKMKEGFNKFGNIFNEPKFNDPKQFETMLKDVVDKLDPDKMIELSKKHAGKNKSSIEYATKVMDDMFGDNPLYQQFREKKLKNLSDDDMIEELVKKYGLQGLLKEMSKKGNDDAIRETMEKAHEKFKEKLGVMREMNNKSTNKEEETKREIHKN